MSQKKNKYILLRIKIFVSMLNKGKFSVKKFINIAYCFLAYLLCLKKTARYPFMINFELTNECNVNCLFCRTLDGEIYDYNPQGAGFIPRGEMDYKLFTSVIDQVKDHLLMAVLYVNGEPLLYKDLFKAIRYVTDRRIASMIATNGLLLTEKNIHELLAAGIDFIKIAISGFTQKIYSIQHRRGNIERIKENIRSLVGYKNEGKHRTIVMVDYILYSYNAHELNDARKFCDELGIMFNVRLGNLRGLEDKEPLPKLVPSDLLSTHCDWPWKLMTINWNGDLYPCCDYLAWSGLKPYARFESGKTIIAEVWNGEVAMRNRIVHCTKGRKAIPLCARCNRQGSTFKY